MHKRFLWLGNRLSILLNKETNANLLMEDLHSNLSETTLSNNTDKDLDLIVYALSDFNALGSDQVGI